MCIPLNRWRIVYIYIYMYSPSNLCKWGVTLNMCKPYHIASLAISGTDSLEVPTTYKAYFLGLNFRKYGQKYGTNVPPPVGS